MKLHELQPKDFDIAEQFAHTSFNSLIDFTREFKKNKANSKKGYTRYFPLSYDSADLWSEPTLAIRESASNVTAEQASNFSKQFKEFDQRINVSIQLGSKVSVISSTISQPQKRIELDGFATPKKITAINKDSNDKIDTIEFADGSQWPELAEFTTINNQYITNTIFFADKQTAHMAYFEIVMLTWPLESNGWQIENRIS